MLETVMQVALLAVAVSTLGFTYRVIVGPTVPDRVVALDAIGVNLVAMCGILSMLLKTNAFLDVILLIGILAFIGTVAFSKFLEKGEIIENEPRR
ncbi:Na(+)/H(+) antiporter subunit F1 [Bacillus thermotolerans]|uniref:Na(+) H(+) antiporter subunit F n=1 Tax=Bacillus thermotolerans TaxID=1221996 RepID=A0A0F5HNZ5_BACTR|nr:Na(+)/H(+) antiporter subunit F1 [Bacillus thermotolerans]KKB34988.1 Na(+) H(+) antiporter subunit F [Bacillus thermotolerans]KKB40602.1 Na(+) H(+) antiporter subunit F [Bacillus thermotolerans]KKB41938.1 Na(+) H(+) antiporter subunit F [Bacillus thermotolerans]